jgi:AraC-like DNA-binding protein
MPLSEGARASALQLLQLDHLRPNVPSDFLSQEAVMFARDQVLLAAELLRPEESQIERASAAAEAWMKAGHLIPLVYVTEHLAMALILRSRATTAVGLIERVLERWLTTGRHDEVSNSLLYCLYKAHQASGNDAAALTQFQRYVESARKSLRPSVSSLHLPMSTANGRMGPGGAPRHLRLAVEIVAQEFSDPALTVESLAARVGVSDRTLRAAFSLHMGKSPLQYLRDFRLDRARDLMLLMLRSRQAHTSIRQIALDCGINHAGRFAHAFAQRFGQSPSDLMRSVELERPSKG